MFLAVSMESLSGITHHFLIPQYLNLSFCKLSRFPRAPYLFNLNVYTFSRNLMASFDALLCAKTKILAA